MFKSTLYSSTTINLHPLIFTLWNSSNYKSKQGYNILCKIWRYIYIFYDVTVDLDLSGDIEESTETFISNVSDDGIVSGTLYNPNDTCYDSNVDDDDTTTSSGLSADGTTLETPVENIFPWNTCFMLSVTWGMCSNRK